MSEPIGSVGPETSGVFDPEVVRSMMRRLLAGPDYPSPRYPEMHPDDWEGTVRLDFPEAVGVTWDFAPYLATPWRSVLDGRDG